MGGVLVRATDANNYFMIGEYGQGFAIHKVVNGTATRLAYTADPSPNTWHRIEVRLQGANVIVSVDGLQKLQVSDSFNISSSRHGLRWYSVYDWASTYDNFSVRTLGATIDHVVVTPGTSVASTGSAQIFAAQAYDTNNTPIPNVHFQMVDFYVLDRPIDDDRPRRVVSDGVWHHEHDDGDGETAVVDGNRFRDRICESVECRCLRQLQRKRIRNACTHAGHRRRWR